MGGVSEKGRRNLNLVDKSALGEPTYEQVGGNPRLLYFRDLKRVLNGLGDDAIYGLLRSGEIPARKIGGKWVTTLEAVEAWLERIGSRDSEISELSLVH